MAVIRYTNTIKTIWEKYLRVAFASDITPDEYKYTASEKTSKIRIYKELPRRVYNLPMIVISAGAGDASLRYLGNEVVKSVATRLAECVLNNTLQYTVMPEGVIRVYTVNQTTGTETEYTIGTDVSFNYTTGKFTWDKDITEPDIYYCTYRTFDIQNSGTQLITKECIQKDTETVSAVNYIPVENGIQEIYSIDESGTKLYYTAQEVYCTANTRQLIWEITEPDIYFVTYLTRQNILDAIGKFVQSMLNVQILFTVYARSSQDRERITDLLVLFIRHVFKDVISQYFTYAGENVSGETQEYLDNQTIYKNSITVPCVTNYSHYIDDTIYALIKSIPIDITVESDI